MITVIADKGSNQVTDYNDNTDKYICFCKYMFFHKNPLNSFSLLYAHFLYILKNIEIFLNLFFTIILW